MMRAVLEIQPSTNFGMSSPQDREGDMYGLAKALMGLSHPVQLVAQCRETTEVYDWAMPPKVTRRWLAVVTADNAGTLEWRTRTLAKTLNGIGLHAREVNGGLGEIVDSVRVSDDYQLRVSDCESEGLDESDGAHVLPSDSPRGGVHLLQIEPDGVFDGTDWCATLVLRRWPREVPPGWLGHALASDLPVDVGIHVEPQDAQQVARFLKRQSKIQAEGNDAGDRLGHDDAERVRTNLIARVDKPCRVAVALTVRAKDRETLRTRVETLQHELGLTLADARLAKWEQDRGLEATLPTGVCRLLGAWRTLDCVSVASTWLFQPATLSHAKGAALGTTHGMLVKLDPFDGSLRSFGGLLTGSVGSGKSYFLKLLLRHLSKDVEIRIVEHSDPPEYDGVPGLLTYNVAELTEAQQAAKLREYITDLWALARVDPRPRLLVLDELWSVLRRAELAALVEEIARRGRKYGLALWIATQQVEELLESGKPVFDNAALKVFLQQEDRDLEGLCKAANLSEAARRVLRSAARGQALIQCGKLLVLVDVQATPEEHSVITTDPRELWAQEMVAV